MLRNVLLAVVLGVVVMPLADADTFGTKKRAPKPSEYGNVVIDNHAARADSDPIVFPHWVHRAKYTCRLCHVDLGFAMTAGETGITDEDNRNGLYCGACHDGQQPCVRDRFCGGARFCRRSSYVEVGGSGSPQISIVFYL